MGVLPEMCHLSCSSDGSGLEVVFGMVWGVWATELVPYALGDLDRLSHAWERHQAHLATMEAEVAEPRRGPTRSAKAHFKACQRLAACVDVQLG